MNFLLEPMCEVILIRAVATGSLPVNCAVLTCASSGAATSVFKRLFGGINSFSASRMCLSADSGGKLLNREDMIQSQAGLRDRARPARQPNRAQSKLRRAYACVSRRSSTHSPKCVGVFGCLTRYRNSCLPATVRLSCVQAIAFHIGPAAQPSLIVSA